MQPPAQGNSEACFRPVKDFGGEVVFERLPQDPFRHAAPEFEGSRDRRGQSGEVAVEKRDADFDAVGHGHLVGVVQVVIGQEEAALEGEHAVERGGVGRERREEISEGGADLLGRGLVPKIRMQKGARDLGRAPLEIGGQAVVLRVARVVQGSAKAAA